MDRWYVQIGRRAHEGTLVSSCHGKIYRNNAAFGVHGRCIVFEAKVQLTSDVYGKVFSSATQSLHFLSTGDELSALPTLQTYSILLWLQLHSPVPFTATVLSQRQSNPQLHNEMHEIRSSEPCPQSSCSSSLVFFLFTALIGFAGLSAGRSL